MIHSYVNVVDRDDEEEPKPALPARNNKTRARSGQRSSRSKERREREVRSDYEKIKEREKELERIHRRSRELMNTSSSGRETSRERTRSSRSKILDHHCRISATAGGGGGGTPYFPPPPCHPPPPLSAAPGSHGRLKSSSPACKEGKQYNNNSMRRRVISPNRKDFRNFSHSQDMKAGMRGGRSTDEEDSGADSLLEVRSTHSSQSCRSWAGPSYPHNMALVPYDSHGSCRSCWSPHHQHSHSHHHDFPLAIPTLSIEDRLRALEDDKDKLHVQVAVMSDQLENQTDKITDLEKVLDDKKEALRKTEDVLQREILNKSSLETQKLELVAEITDIKVKLNSTERENQELRRRLAQAHHQTESSVDSSATLPRRSQPPPLGVFRPFKLPDRALEVEETSQTKTESKQSFFRRSGSVRESRSKTSSRNRERDKSKESQDNSIPIATKPKGFKKILSKMRRANSGPIPQDLKAEFETDKEQVRASAGSQLALGWELHKSSVPFESEVPFLEWDADIICSWFDSMGLYMYSKEVRKNVKTGQQLSAFTNTELEQKLGLHNFLHRKKVLLAIMTRVQSCEDCAGAVGYHGTSQNMINFPLSLTISG